MSKEGGKGEITIEFWAPTHTLSLLSFLLVMRDIGFPHTHCNKRGEEGNSKSHFPRIFVRSPIVTLGETQTPFLKEGLVVVVVVVVARDVYENLQEQKGKREDEDLLL